MFPQKAEEKKDKKLYICDYSFYIYNGSFAYKYPCKNAKKNDKGKFVCECNDCEGSGFIYMHAKGTRTGGLYHVVNAIVPKMQAGYEVALIFDPPKENLTRTKLLDNYKGNRPPTPEWIEWQMNWGERIFPHTKNVQCYTAEDSESDDVMATLALEKANEGYLVEVASDDKDMLPLLVHPRIELFRQKARFTKDDFGPYMKKKYNVDIKDPARFSEFLAIIGDAADNYNIIKGLGPKAAEYFINKYENIMDLFDDWDSIPVKYQKKLVYEKDGKVCKMKDELQTSLQLAYLDLEVNYKPIKLKDDETLVMDAFEKLQLKTAITNFELFFR